MSPEEYMAKAKRAIDSAHLLLDDENVDAAHAALLSVQNPANLAITRTHRGLIGAFGQYLIKPGLLEVELGRMLNQVQQIRLLADYTGEEIYLDKGLWAVEKPKFFVDEVEKYLGN